MEYHVAWDALKEALKDEEACRRYEESLSRKNDLLQKEVERIRAEEIEFRWHKCKELVIPAKVRGYVQ